MDEHVSLGYDVVKIHQNISRTSYDALISGAKARGLRVTGHLQHWMPLQESLRMTAVEHVEEFLYTKIDGFTEPENGGFLDWPQYYAHCKKMQDAAYRKPMVDLVVGSGVYVDPTLLIYQSVANWVDDDYFAQLHLDPNLIYLPKSVCSEYLNPSTNEYRQKGFPFSSAHLKTNFETLKALVYDLHQAGVPLLLGTDAFGTVVPGFALHQELALMVSAGISPFEALRMGTVNVAAYLNETDSAGTIEVGKRADFILLKQNPLANIHHTREVQGVFTQGEWYSEAVLKSLLLDAKKRSSEAE